MGITGLIPFLEKATSHVNIKHLEGSSVAVDSYCWLHKGVFACAEKLVRGEKTDIHIKYCLKYLDMLLGYNIKVIMVFDGRHLPAKAEIERRRRQGRHESKIKAKEYLRNNDIEKARSYMRRAIDVTHEMALELIKACRNRGVDCIVAPYEADAQMAWLNMHGLADYVVTEDSDLTLFGAKKILFKLDLAGNACMVENTKLYLAMGCQPERYTFDKFRRMCILSGCDYLDSLPGIGLKKACKFILTTEQDDMKIALKKLPGYLNMTQLHVSDEYIESFLKAEATFKHMFIYNPIERRMQRLHELEEFQTDESHCCNAGSLLDDVEQIFQLALGNLNPFTLQQMDNWQPNRNWSQIKSKHRSIWQNSNGVQAIENPGHKSGHHEKTEDSMFDFKKIEFKNIADIETNEKLVEERSKLEESEIFSMYKHMSPKMEQKRKRQSSSSSSEEESEKKFDPTMKKCSTHNPFAKPNISLGELKRSPVCANNSLLKILSPKKNNQQNCNQMASTNNTSVKSRFFADNIKQVVEQKPFAARDLTSEMLKIESKANAYIEKQQELYYCSLQSPENKVPNMEKHTFDDIRVLPNNIYQIDELRSAEEQSSNPNSSNQISQETKASPSSVSEEMILFSDVEEDQCSQNHSVLSKVQTFSKKSNPFPKTKNKSQATQRKLTKVNSENSDTKQLKLSMFGFQKRPLLRK